MKHRVGRVVTLLLLVLYMAGSSDFEVLHSLVHVHDQIVTHSAEQEHDPCHRSMYHRDVEQGCDHESHFVVSNKCQMCDLAFHGDQHIVVSLVFNTEKFSSPHFDGYKVKLDSYWCVISSSRAPPSLG